MQRKVILSTTLTTAAQIQQLSTLPSEVSLIEVRADAFNVDLKTLKKSTTTPLLFSLKSKTEGGLFNGTKQQRTSQLIDAAAHYKLIELEGERDLIPEILEAIPVQKRIITWQGKTESYEALTNRLERYQETPAKYYRLIVQAKKSGDEVPVLRLLKAAKRKDLIAYATGSIGLWTQPLAPFLGSPLTPSTLNTGEPKTHLSPRQLIEDYNLPHTYRIEKIYGIVGNPVFGSISPKLHNEAYRKLDLPYLYLPFQPKTLQDFFDGVVSDSVPQINFSGFTVVSPFKEAGLKTAGMTYDCDVAISEASNIIVNQNVIGWAALSTDALGAIDALNKTAPNWQEKNIAIIGLGGAGRTIAAGLKRMSVHPTLINRTTKKGQQIAAAMKLPFIPLKSFDPSSFDIIIHVTPLGKNKGEAPFDVSLLNRNSIVIDHVYATNRETELIRYCELCNIKAINGKEMARLQIRHQFKFMTGLEIPLVKQSNKSLKTTR
jgi:3-dehydroquinate dehydratase/shikimate dehydrogenase